MVDHDCREKLQGRKKGDATKLSMLSFFISLLLSLHRVSFVVVVLFVCH